MSGDFNPLLPGDFHGSSRSRVYSLSVLGGYQSCSRTKKGSSLLFFLVLNRPESSLLPESFASEGSCGTWSMVAADGGSDKDAPLHKQVIAVTAFASCNVGLNVFNSWALNRNHWPDFVFPIF